MLSRRPTAKRLARLSPCTALQSLESRILLSATKVGPETRVNTTTVNQQIYQDVAMDAGGDYIVVWQSYQNATDYDIYAQRYSAWGAKVGVQFRVNTVGTGEQVDPVVAMSADGSFAIAWIGTQSGEDDIYVRRFNAAGVAQGVEVMANTATGSNHQNPAIAMNPAGKFVVTWNDTPAGASNSVYAQVFTSSGGRIGGELRANSDTTDSQYEPSVAMDSLGNFAITWTDFYSPTADKYVKAQRFNSWGIPLGNNFYVNTYQSGSQETPAIAMDGVGNFVIAWSSVGQDLSDRGIYAQRYNASGVPQGGEFRVNTTTTLTQELPDIAMDPAGNFVITWDSLQLGTNDIYAQLYNAAGMMQGPEFQVHPPRDFNQFVPTAAMDSAGNFIVAWSSNFQDGDGFGIYSQLYAHKIDYAGVQRGASFYLDSNHDDNYNGNSTIADDTLTTFGASGDKPVIGDWNKDGFDDIGVWRAGFFYLDANGNGTYDGATLDRYFSFGLTTDTPIAGDWDGDGKDEIGVWRAGKFYLDVNGNRTFDATDATYTFGASTDTPLIGDWNGDGIDDIGVWRAGKFYLDMNGDHLWGRPDVDAVFSFGNPTDKPVVGDWNGDGRDKVGVRRTSQFWTDYNGDRKWDTADGPYTIDFGVTSDVPLVGFWRPRAVPGVPPAAPAGISIVAPSAEQVAAPTITAAQIDPSSRIQAAVSTSSVLMPKTTSGVKRGHHKHAGKSLFTTADLLQAKIGSEL
ncbi:MAG: VCBS repeat-containing protein [Planctomycetales bacterium]